MFSRFWAGIPVGVLLLATPQTGAQLSLPDSIAEGKPFPALALPTLDGEPRSIADFRGTKLVLHVFASW